MGIFKRGDFYDFVQALFIINNFASRIVAFETRRLSVKCLQLIKTVSWL